MFRFITPAITAGRTSFSLRATAIDTGGNTNSTGEITVALTPDLTPPRSVLVLATTIELPSGDPCFTAAPWADAETLPPPKNWGALPDGKIPADTLGFDSATGLPRRWPMRLAKVHWAALLPGQPAGILAFQHPRSTELHAALERENIRDCPRPVAETVFGAQSEASAGLSKVVLRKCS
jgi:hypothetical protein